MDKAAALGVLARLPGRKANLAAGHLTAAPPPPSTSAATPPVWTLLTGELAKLLAVVALMQVWAWSFQVNTLTAIALM
jgi:hypothetical protein